MPENFDKYAESYNISPKEDEKQYQYGLLDPRPKPETEAANAKLLGENTLGIEVTDKKLAGRCGLGNIDPQHSEGRVDRAAIEECLEAALPPKDAVFVTVRPDLDAIGGMAVLTLRMEGKVFSGEALERIKIIAQADKFSRGEWPGPRPLPSLEKLYDDSLANAETDSRLAPIAAAVMDFKIPIETRVNWMKEWLVSGKEPEGYKENWLKDRQAMAEAIANGEIKAETTADGRIAIVESKHRAGTSIGYSLAPVVISLNPEFRFQGGEPHRKYTIAQFAGGHVDLKAAAKELNELEPGWGGSPAIIGSPQGKNSGLSAKQVLEIITKHLTPKPPA